MGRDPPAGRGPSALAGRPADGVGQERRLLPGDPIAEGAGGRADAAGLAAAGADAEPDRGRAPDRGRGRRHQLDQPGRLGRRRAAHRGGHAGRAADLARAAGQRRLPPERAPARRRPGGAVRRRRGPLHLGLGPRLPARLPAHRQGAPPAAVVGRRARDDGDGQRPGGPGRGGPTRRRRPDDPRRVGPLVAAVAGDAAAAPGPTPGLAGGRAPPGRRQRHRLRADGAGRAPRERVAPVARHRRPAVLRQPADRRARSLGRTTARQRRQGAGGHERLGHGVRQARPGVRGPLPAAGLGRGVLPAGRPCRPRGRRRLRRAAERRRGRRDHGLLYRVGLPAGGARRRHPGRAGGRRADDERPPAGPQPVRRSDRQGAQAARRHRPVAGRTGRPPVGHDRRALGRRPGPPSQADGHPPRRAGADAALHGRRALPHGLSARGPGRPRRPALRALHGLRGPRPAGGGARPSAGPPGRGVPGRLRAAHRAPQAEAGSDQAPRGRARRAGPRAVLLQRARLGTRGSRRAARPATSPTSWSRPPRR